MAANASAQTRLNDATPGTRLYKWLERHRTLLECTGVLPRPPYRVLDLGSGSGLLAVWAARQGWDVTAVELEADHMAVLRQFVAAEPELQITPVQSSILASRPLLPDDAFDIVYLKDVLEHVGNYQMCLDIAYAKAKSGGLVFASTTNVICPLQSEYHGVGPFSWYPRPVKNWIVNYALNHNPGIIMHSKLPAVHWFRRGTLSQAMRRSGFRRTWDLYDLVKSTADVTGRTRYVVPLIRLAGLVPPGRHLVDLLIPGLTMVAQK